MQALTRDEWNKISSDYKGIRPDGTYCILEFHPHKGTVLVPVIVIGEPTREEFAVELLERICLANAKGELDQWLSMILSEWLRYPYRGKNG